MKTLDGIKFYGEPVQNMNADELLELVAYLVEENQRLKNQAKRHMEIMTLKPKEGKKYENI